MKENPLASIINIFNKLSLQQKLVVGGTVVTTIVLLIIFLFFLNQPVYAPLYTNLNEQDASKIVEELNSQKVPYEIDDNGKTIKVLKDKVYEQRLDLASKGIPSSGVVGYEIFDKNTMGMSEFMQKLNYIRALEGELAKTVGSLNGVEGARVHIVLPEKSVFKDEQKPPTAAVVLKLRSNFSLSRNNVDAIVNLVSSSVEGLKPGKVTLLDTKGKLLTKEDDSDPLAVSSSKQYEIKKSVETYLAQKAQSILNNVIGYGNAIVEVNADLNFDQVQKTMESYDPDSQVAVSEQTVKSSNDGKNLGDSTSQVSQNTTTNYEINKTIQKVIESSGNITRLSVAVVVNDIPKKVTKAGKEEIAYDPRPKEQLKKLEDIIKNAVGINPTRNDLFTIESIPFETREIEPVEVTKPGGMMDDVNKWSNPILLILAALASLLFLRGLMKKLKNQKIIIGSYNNTERVSTNLMPESLSQPSAPQMLETKKFKKNLLPLGDLEDEISDEAARKRTQQEKISNYVAKNPLDAAKLINAWLHEEEF